MFNFRKALISAGVGMLLLSVVAVTAFAEGSKVGIVNCEGALNMRKSPNTSSLILEQLSEGSKVSILSSSDGWYKVTYNSITGWVCGDYITVKTVTSGSSASAASKSGTILGDSVNVRSSASTESQVLTQVDKGDKVSVYSVTGSWCKVKTSNGISGWISKDYVSVNGSSSRNAVVSAVREVPAAVEKPEAGTAQKLVAYAKKFLGVRYVYGGSSPSGFDCSGFVKYVFDKYGINLERVAANQAGQGTKVSKANLRPGDVVFFDTNGNHNYINHVGIYIGSGNFIHASSGSSKHKVVISNLTEGFYADAYMTARRFLK